MPIPESYAIPVGDSQQYELLPDDIYDVQITKIELRTDQPIYQSTDTEDKFSFEFTIAEQGEFYGRKLWLDVRTVMTAGWAGGSPSWLYRIYCAANGITTKMDDDAVRQVSARSINALEGSFLRLVVKQKPNQSNVLKNKIVDVMAMKQTTPPQQQPASVPPLPEDWEVLDDTMPAL